MAPAVEERTVPARLLAAARRTVRVGEVGTAWRPALDEVWAFLRAQPSLRTDGHNVFLYHHPARRDLPMEVDFGVEVVREFAPQGGVRPARTPAGRVASVLHVGPVARLREAHDAIHAWAAANRARLAGQSWEIYGDWTADASRQETRIEYLLKE